MAAASVRLLGISTPLLPELTPTSGQRFKDLKKAIKSDNKDLALRLLEAIENANKQQLGKNKDLKRKVGDLYNSNEAFKEAALKIDYLNLQIQKYIREKRLLKYQICILSERLNELLIQQGNKPLSHSSSKCLSHSKSQESLPPLPPGGFGLRVYRLNPVSQLPPKKVVKQVPQPGSSQSGSPSSSGSREPSTKKTKELRKDGETPSSSRRNDKLPIIVGIEKK